MDETLRRQDGDYFPIFEVEPLRETQNEVLKKLADFLAKELPQVEVELSKYGLKDNGGQDLCEHASRLLQDTLKKALKEEYNWWFPERK